VIVWTACLQNLVNVRCDLVVDAETDWKPVQLFYEHFVKHSAKLKILGATLDANLTIKALSSSCFFTFILSGKFVHH